VSLTTKDLAKIPDRPFGVRYKRHPVFKDYIIGTDGSVHSTLHPRYKGQDQRSPRNPFLRLAGSTNNRGYLTISRRTNGYRTDTKIHRMVLETFVGPKPLGLWGLHKNDIKSDNSLSNLEYGSPKKNSEHRIHNRTLRGETNPIIKLTASQVKEIRASPTTWGYGRLLATKFGVTDATISDIKARRCWKHL